jgi:hypothetical protein
MVWCRIGWLRLTVRTYSPLRARICSTLRRWTCSASYEDLRVMPRCCPETLLAAASLDGTSA